MSNKAGDKLLQREARSGVVEERHVVRRGESHRLAEVALDIQRAVGQASARRLPVRNVELAAVGEAKGHAHGAAVRRDSRGDVGGCKPFSV